MLLQTGLNLGPFSPSSPRRRGADTCNSIIAPAAAEAEIEKLTTGRCRDSPNSLGSSLSSLFQKHSSLTVSIMLEQKFWTTTCNTTANSGGGSSSYHIKVQRPPSSPPHSVRPSSVRRPPRFFAPATSLSPSRSLHTASLSPS